MYAWYINAAAIKVDIIATTIRAQFFRADNLKAKNIWRTANAKPAAKIPITSMWTVSTGILGAEIESLISFSVKIACVTK